MSDGRENYSSYYYLWHLVAIGVLEVTPPAAGSSCPTIDDVIWDKPIFNRQSSKVALIDMGVAKDHPNLDPKQGGVDPQDPRVMWDLALDLASHRYGATYGPLPAADADRHLEERLQHLDNIQDDGILIGNINPDAAEQAILDRLRDNFGVKRYVDVYKQSYATHGTACAGLVSGTSFEDDQFGFSGNPIVYYGVDPYSKIIPITTSISPDPEQLIAAFLYAYSQDVDVILFPRDAANPAEMPNYALLDKNEKTRLDDPGPQDVAWSLFEKVIVEVSKKIPVVCAAGNDGRSQLIYPASLAVNPANGIIAVGSVSYRGYRSGYSSYGAGLTAVAPSDDGELYNRYQLRLDKQAAGAIDFWTENVHKHPSIPEIEYSAERLISLDVPGPRGYMAGSREGPTADRDEAVDDPGGLYTGIGGTSGSSAIVAGVVSLMQRKSAARVDGPIIKQALLSMGAPNTSVSHWYWLDPLRTNLVGDAVNGLTIPSDIELFGDGGLIDVPTLLGL